METIRFGFGYVTNRSPNTSNKSGRSSTNHLIFNLACSQSMRFFEDISLFSTNTNKTSHFIEWKISTLVFAFRFLNFFDTSSLLCVYVFFWLLSDYKNISSLSCVCVCVCQMMWRCMFCEWRDSYHFSVEKCMRMSHCCDPKISFHLCVDRYNIAYVTWLDFVRLVHNYNWMSF